MYLLYLDESGARDSRHFVVGGLAIHEQDAHPLGRAVDRLFGQLPQGVTGSELHAQHVRAGKGAWRSIPKDVRRQLTGDIADLLTGTLSGAVRPPVLFSVVIHKPSFPHRDPFERTCEEFFARCDGFPGRLAASGDHHRCMAIADKSGIEPIVQGFMRSWREKGASTGAAIGPMTAYAEAPLFVDSTASRLVQLADFVPTGCTGRTKRATPACSTGCCPCSTPTAAQSTASCISWSGTGSAGARRAHPAADRSRRYRAPARSDASRRSTAARSAAPRIRSRKRASDPARSRISRIAGPSGSVASGRSA